MGPVCVCVLSLLQILADKILKTSLALTSFETVAKLHKSNKSLFIIRVNAQNELDYLGKSTGKNLPLQKNAVNFYHKRN